MTSLGFLSNFWMVVDGSGWLWMVVGDFLGGCGWLWVVVGNCG